METSLTASIKGKNNRPSRIAIYVIYDKDGILDGFRKYYLKELGKVVDHILAVVCGELTSESRNELYDFVDEIYVRENKGLLAGAWVDGIAHIGWDTLDKYDELFMLNDSFFGPFYPLEDMMDAMEKSDSDFYGALRNFEDKNITSFFGHSLKHGHIRGSICYFYIIKSRLLHSPEFRKYWEKMPEVNQDGDTYFYAELNFYDYVIDAGFKVDSYQSDKLKGYFFDNLTHNMKKLVQGDKIPFARIRPFGSDMMYQGLSMGYARDPRDTLQYIDEHTDYDVDLIWDYLLRTKNLTDIYYQLQLENVVPKNIVEKPFEYSKKCAVILHIYYKDLVERLADYCLNFPDNTDFYITTTTEETNEIIKREFKARNLNFTSKIRPNVGVAMSTLWVTYADVVTSGEYEYICYFHDKKSPYLDYTMHGDSFATRCYDNLFGTKEIVKNIINIFEDNKRLGMLGVPVVYHGQYFGVHVLTWPVNYENTVKLAKKLKLNVPIKQDVIPVAPYGDMFWFRADALKKAIGQGLTYDDFDVEYKSDGTFMHAIERIYGFCVQDAGYYYAEVMNTDDARSDLINYQYMLYNIVDILISNKQMVTNYEVTKDVIRYHTSPDSKMSVMTARMALKTIIKAKIPKPIWKFFKKIYHAFGGKKWVG